MRSRRYKYIAFRGCEDLAFDIQADPDEQHNLLAGNSGNEPSELLALRDAVLNGFSFDDAEETREREAKPLRERYAAKVKPDTPNQILLGDGRLVEADAPLYLSHVVSENLTSDFSRS